MASPKEYAYYIEGSKIAVVERDVAFDNDPNSKNYGPGTDKYVWKSPLSSVTDGIEIQYASSPSYHISTTPVINKNKFFVNGWTVVGGYLTFVRDELEDCTDWTASPASAVGVDEYILVEGSSRWNGIHKVKARNTDGELTTYTKAKGNYKYYQDVDIDFTTAEIVRDGAGSDNLFLANHFTTSDYIFISGCGTGQNNGIFTIKSIAQTAVDTTSTLTVGTKYSVSTAANQAITGVQDLATEVKTIPEMANFAGSSTINIYQVEKDFCSVLADIDVLDDESDTIHVPSYLSKALVYHVKAQVAEDLGDMDLREYFRKEFRTRVEKYNNNRIPGLRILASGPNAIR